MRDITSCRFALKGTVCESRKVSKMRELVGWCAKTITSSGDRVLMLGVKGYQRGPKLEITADGHLSMTI